MTEVASKLESNDQQRLNAKSIARILSVVTLLMLATGLIAVSRLTGGSRPPVLELTAPIASEEPGGAEADREQEEPIQILLPEPTVSDITPLELSGDAVPAWQSPAEQLRPMPIRTATEPSSRQLR